MQLICFEKNMRNGIGIIINNTFAEMQATEANNRLITVAELE